MDPILKKKVMRRLKRARAVWYDCYEDDRATRKEARGYVGKWKKTDLKTDQENLIFIRNSLYLSNDM